MSNGFQLKDFSSFNIFSSTDPNRKIETTNVDIKHLRPYSNHPFKLYTGQRFNDMVESIRDIGIIYPIIVRPVKGHDFDYEILSGHNRVKAAQAAGVDPVPCIVKDGLTDEEAHLIVTESNLIQRSFSDLSHSERAEALAVHHEALKQQGKRTDIINEIENLLNASDNAGFETSLPVAKKLTSMGVVGEKYGLSKDNVARYLRLNRLLTCHKERLDNNELSIRAGVTLSYLTANEQEIVDTILNSGDYKLDMKKAEHLRTLSERGKLTSESAEGILAGKKKVNKPKGPSSIKLKRKKFDTYFSKDDTEEIIETTILKALEFYFEHKNEPEQMGGDVD